MMWTFWLMLRPGRRDCGEAMSKLSKWTSVFILISDARLWESDSDGELSQKSAPCIGELFISQISGEHSHHG